MGHNVGTEIIKGGWRRRDYSAGPAHPEKRRRQSEGRKNPKAQTIARQQPLPHLVFWLSQVSSKPSGQYWASFVFLIFLFPRPYHTPAPDRGKKVGEVLLALIRSSAFSSGSFATGARRQRAAGGGGRQLRRRRGQRAGGGSKQGLTSRGTSTTAGSNRSTVTL